ncbi:opsin-VA-like [Triplophysa rosa]|nr:opsin-VA-like [Triplophysa rosa]
MNIIILSLAFSDFMIAACGSAIVTVTNYEGSFFLDDSFCVFQGFAVNYFGVVSLCTITLLAYERYNAVCKPMAGYKLSICRSCMGLLFVWLYCLFWTAVPLLGWSSYGPKGILTSCSLNWGERSWNNYSYLIFYMLLCFILSTVIIIFLISLKKINKNIELQGGKNCEDDKEHASRMVLL